MLIYSHGKDIARRESEMTDYEALLEVINDEDAYLRKKRDKARDAYKETKSDPDATERDREEARLELRLARARWFAMEVLLNDIEEKVRCKVSGIEYM